MTPITPELFRHLFPPRDPRADKRAFGRLLIIAGSTGFSGAAWFAASAAVRCGAGTVTVGVPESIWNQVAPGVREAMCYPLRCDKAGRLSPDAFEWILERRESCDAAVCGPGLGTSETLSELVTLLMSGSKPLVLDADGINSKSGHILKCPLVLTPHEGEFLRAGGELSGGREAGAADFIERYPCTLVLKGHKTLVYSPGCGPLVNTTGNPGMARGGSGDVLAGMIGAFAARGIEPHMAAAAGVWLHGRAGDICAARLGEEAMTPSDMIGALPEAFREITNIPDGS